MTRHLIIGGGIAGLSAAEALRQHEPSAEIVMICDERHGFYSRPGLAYLISGALPEKALAIREPRAVRELGLDQRADEVVALDTAAHAARMKSGEVVRYDRALIATGSVALRPDFPGGDLDGVVQLDGLDEARAIVARAKKAKAAVVVGGGPTALELADGLRAQGVDVHYLMRGARYWASVLDPFESQAIEDALAHEGIKVHPRTKIARAIADEGGKVAGVETDQGETIACDLVAVAIGVIPRMGLARAAGLAIDRGVLVDEYLRTSAPDVFAAGDVAQIRDPATGASHMDVLWSTALRSGRAAGRGMAGAWKPFRRATSLNVTRLGGVIVTVIGAVGQPGGADADGDLVTIARGDSEAWRDRPAAWTIEAHRSARSLRAIVDGSRVIGAVVMGDPAASRALCRLIDRRVDVSALRPDLERDADAALDALIALGEQDDGAARA